MSSDWSAGPAWTPLDVEKPPAADVPAADIPDADALRRAIALPPIPDDVPGVEALLQAFAQELLDPWGPDLTGEVAGGK